MNDVLKDLLLDKRFCIYSLCGYCFNKIIELTSPYMHNGVFDTLEEVMDYYNKGGGSGLKIAPAYQTLPGDSLNFSKKEISDIIAFMKTLTDIASRPYQ